MSAPAAALLKRSTNPSAAPVDWQGQWSKPLVWPKAAGAVARNAKTALADHRAFRPVLSRSALVLIDVDKKSFDQNIESSMCHDPKIGRALSRRTYQIALPNLIRLIEFFRKRRLPVIFVQWGWHRYQYPPLEARPGETIIVKHGRGAFGTSGLDAALRRGRIETCVFAGADTAFCVASTVRWAIDHNYRAVLVEDACVCGLEEMHAAAVKTLGWMQAHIMKTKQVLRLTRS